MQEQSQLPEAPRKPKTSRSPWLLPLILIVWPFILGPIATFLLFDLQPSASPQAPVSILVSLGGLSMPLAVFVGPVSVLIGTILLLARKPWRKNAQN